MFNQASKLIPRAEINGNSLTPQETGEFSYTEDQAEITHIRGEVTIPGVDKPIEYVGSMPDNLSTDVLNLVVPGFGGIKRSYKSFADIMAAQEEIFTVSFAPARSGPSILDPQLVHEDTIKAITQGIASNKELEGSGIDFGHFTASLHSMGAIAGTRHAKSYPSEVASMIYVNPVGFEPSGAYAKYIRRIGPCAVKEIIPGFLKREFKDHQNLMTGINMGKHLLGNVIQTGGEIYSCHTADLRRDVTRLRAMGLGLGVILGGKDGLVSSEASASEVKYLVDHCEIVPELDHFGPQKQPDKVATYVGSMIRQLA